MEVVSPITHSRNVVIEKKISTTWLISEYQRELKIDVFKYFQNLDEILVYKCMDTGYRFYFPFFTAGDGDFYSAMEKFSWYYMDDKWEHNEALKYVQKGFKVLEIGSGPGSFLKKALERAELCVGLEVNTSAVNDACAKGLNVFAETVEAHAKNHRNFYDIVCMFQVLEHISNVNEFIQTSLMTLKIGGFLIVSVPNNESFIIQENTLIANMPPHHMGLWTLNALLGLQNYFSVKTESLQFEPLQPYHFGYGIDLLMKRYSNQRPTFIQRLVEKSAKILFNKFPTLHELAELSTSTFSSYLPGQSIMAIYRKVER